jgi:hypothetical protein
MLNFEGSDDESRNCANGSTDPSTRDFLSGG